MDIFLNENMEKFHDIDANASYGKYNTWYNRIARKHLQSHIWQRLLSYKEFLQLIVETIHIKKSSKEFEKKNI